MGEESRSQLASKYTPKVCNEYSNKTFMQRAYYRMFPYYHILGFYSSRPNQLLQDAITPYARSFELRQVMRSWGGPFTSVSPQVPNLVIRIHTDTTELDLRQLNKNNHKRDYKGHLPATCTLPLHWCPLCSSRDKNTHIHVQFLEPVAQQLFAGFSAQ